jgi:hypothetical protein
MDSTHFFWADFHWSGRENVGFAILFVLFRVFLFLELGLCGRHMLFQ